MLAWCDVLVLQTNVRDKRKGKVSKNFFISSYIIFHQFLHYFSAFFCFIVAKKMNCVRSPLYQTSLHHSSSALKKLDEDRLTNQLFCDFTIKTETKDFPVHKCLLGVTSKFFKRMFETNMKEKFENCVVIENIETKIIKVVIEFLYGNTDSIDSDNVYEVLKAADYLQVQDLMTHCADLMTRNLTEKNAITIWMFAKQYNLENLVTESQYILSSKFVFILKQEEFLKICPESITDFMKLRCEDITEENIYEAIMKWVDFDSDNRCKYFSSLFQLLDLSKVNKKFLCEVISNNKLVHDDCKCSEMLLKTMNKIINEQAVLLESFFDIAQYFKYFDGKKSSIANASRLFTKMFEFVVAGQGDNYKAVRKYNVATKQWKDLGETCWSRVYSGMACVDDKLYVMGGRVSRANLNSITVTECLDLKTEKRWNEKASMIQKRHNFGCAVYNSQIYVVGGQAYKKKWLSSVECYSPWNDVWINQPHLNFKRAGCCLINFNGQLHVLGGFNRSGYLDSMEIFNGKNWVMGVSMNCARANFAAVVLNKELYAICGEDSDYDYLSSVEKYNDEVGHWVDVRNLNNARAKHHAFVLNEKIYVVGGGDERLEVFYPDDNQWKNEKDCPIEDRSNPMIALN